MRVFAATEAWVKRWCAPIVRGWRASVIVTGVAVAVAFILLLTDPDLGEIANLLILAPITGLILIGLLVRQRGSTKLVCLMLLCCYALSSWQITKHWMEIRADLRWLAGSRSWKEEALRQDSVPGSGMKWVVWDGWGMFGMDTDVYLVYSPDDQLRNYSPSRLSGLPCPVSQVQRLEQQWYSVTLYTGEGWDDCGAAAR